ncbi:hypothetical protein HMPREF9134_01400 [Porphyromonas catoniae F0037]|uniref:Uncharacterized protein n=1 Tax=Porphyromonas catoniae F0037 TaxID=1127696 RepID=L1NBA9_9PORP|nr:hypothetical protein HMPREF9134_01400 [Porphyromonas catoniae F0037]
MSLPHDTILLFQSPTRRPLDLSPHVANRYRGKLSRGIGENPKEVTGIPLESFP